MLCNLPLLAYISPVDCMFGSMVISKYYLAAKKSRKGGGQRSKKLETQFRDNR